MSNNHISVFEHEPLTIGKKGLDKEKLQALQKYYGDGGKKFPYYSLINNGIRFNQYVGVIQVGDLTIEVLPKADKLDNKNTGEIQWKEVLIGMLLAVNNLEAKSQSSSQLKIRKNSILDLYFSIFITEVEYLLHSGLVKKYRKTEGNVTALKGNLLFNKHIQQNLTHKERFFVRYTTYDKEHQIHFILYKTIRLLKKINTNTELHSRIGVLLLDFPEMPDLKISEATFDKITFDRKTDPYKKSIGIAKLLLLKYHPDVSKGNNDVLALMFDMNQLWEQFIYITLFKCNKNHEITVAKQISKNFWKPDNGNEKSTMKADIVIKNKETYIVLDTKWKNLGGKSPSPEDLRQMYVYHEYYSAKQVALIYPGLEAFISGSYLDPKQGTPTDKKCSVICLSVESNIKDWQKKIKSDIGNALNIEFSDIPEKTSHT